MMKNLLTLRRWTARPLIGLCLGLCVSLPVHGQTCSITATPLAFGTYNPMSALESDSSANISVVCQAVVSILVSYSVKLSSGTSGSSYNTGAYLLSVLTPVTNTYTAYGRIPALQNVYAGVYTDTLTILVTY